MAIEKSARSDGAKINKMSAEKKFQRLRLTSPKADLQSAFSKEVANGSYFHRRKGPRLIISDSYRALSKFQRGATRSASRWVPLCPPSNFKEFITLAQRVELKVSPERVPRSLCPNYSSIRSNIPCARFQLHQSLRYDN